MISVMNKYVKAIRSQRRQQDQSSRVSVSSRRELGARSRTLHGAMDKAGPFWEPFLSLSFPFWEPYSPRNNIGNPRLFYMFFWYFLGHCIPFFRAYVRFLPLLGALASPIFPLIRIPDCVLIFPCLNIPRLYVFPFLDNRGLSRKFRHPVLLGQLAPVRVPTTPFEHIFQIKMFVVDGPPFGCRVFAREL